MLPMFIALSVIAGMLIGIYLPRKSNDPQHFGFKSKNDKINMVLNRIESDYVDPVNRNELVETAIPANAPTKVGIE